MRKFFTLQEKRDIVDEAWELPGIIKAVARKYGIGASNIRRWKANFHDFDNRYSDVEGLLSDEGRLLLKKQTTHLGKSCSNTSATEFAAICLLYDQLRGDDRACSIMLLAAELKRLLGHVASLSVIQQCVASSLVHIPKHCVSSYHPQGTKHALCTECHAGVSPVHKHTVS